MLGILYVSVVQNTLCGAVVEFILQTLALVDLLQQSHNKKAKRNYAI